MEEQVAWGMGKPGVEDQLLSAQSNTEAYYGRLNAARDFSERAVESAKRAGASETAAGWKASAALREVEIGNIARGREGTAEALALSTGVNSSLTAALSLARAGEAEQAQSLIDRLNHEYPLDTMVQSYLLPICRAAIALQKNNPRKAIEALQVVTPYEMGTTSFGNLYPFYLRGLCFMKAGEGREAAAEFQKVLDHPGIVGNFIIGTLARLQLGRAQAMMGDKAAARKSYQDFLTLWKDADPDIPVYRQAKAEYARLR